MRDHYPEIQARGAEIVVIGTGDLRYAKAFCHDERIPFPVLVDDAGLAAGAARVERVGFARLFAWASLPATARALRRGHRIGRPGKRVNQLGATFVLDPGTPEGGRSRVLFGHHDAHPADHAPISAIFAALRRSEPLA